MKAKLYRKSLAIAILAIVGVFLSANSAFAAGNNEGRGGNSVSCTGVKTQAAAVALAKGAPDMCGHSDVARIWKTFGITPQVVNTMHRGTVCASEGWTSSGRNHSPNASMDVRQPGGFYTRPLKVWGNVCYDAWITTLEDGTQVAILVGCGNAEMRKGHRPALKPKPAPKQVVHKKPVVKTKPVKVSVTCPSGTTKVMKKGRLTGCRAKVLAPVPAISGCAAGSLNIAPVGSPLNCVSQPVTQSPSVTAPVTTSGPQSPAVSVPVVVGVAVPVTNNVSNGQTQSQSPPPSCTTCTTTTTPAPTPAPNRSPLVQIINAPAHVFVSGQVQICAQISDPDGDTVIVTIKGDPGWTRGTTSAPSQTGAQTWCTTYTAPATAGDDIVTFRVSDGKNPAVEVSTPRFPIVASSGSNF